MSGFSSEWLALREPLDLAARNAGVEEAFLAQLPERPLRILDLASGAGSTIAALQGKFRQPVNWLLTDHDPALLEVAAARWDRGAASGVETRQVDLAGDLEGLPLADVEAVTTSAFLDLVSDEFLLRLTDRIVRSGKPFLASLTYDGRTAFEPSHPFDAEMCASLNAHQKSDKGFGPALGPDAAARAAGLFEDRGYRVVRGPSDWQAGSAASGFLQEFLQGWVRVGRETGLDKTALEAWWRDRQNKIRSGELHAEVGHLDFAAFPA
ncbi:class I SAM-dependent methyltransferase [Labrenzia sp. 011]|uniref:class I SAM-dependent methyltransferase n=1 Tax=Labrenzia sp. 011 TaxID=2171494 RepID=UPI000D50C31B|nr:class I SAM-dependent methyltransferase [Labrenzia sp. 011]PVB60680.1 methyltransferase type 11 [Labrenzia sp. 011]